DLSARAEAARESASDLADFLGSQLLPAAGENAACGREDYGLHSRDFLGAEVDFDETYEWGLEELARIDAEQREVAARVMPGADPRAGVEALADAPSRSRPGSAAPGGWMQRAASEALTALGPPHCDSREPARTIQCIIAPSATGGI